MSKIRVAVLGATGMIGQRFVQMLEGHPYFEIEGLYASDRSDGKKLKDVLKVRDFEYKNETLDMKMETMDLKKIAKNARVAFSGLPSDLAGKTESDLAEGGIAVFSNAGAHRMDKDVSILIPEVNPSHLDSVKDQATYGNGGYIVTNANCSTTGIAPPLAAVRDAYGLDFVSVSTYQALSGAGYPGVPSLDAVGNVIPFIGGEEEKMEAEIVKILGTYEDRSFNYAKFRMLANCARVPVIDGHLESLVIKMDDTPSVEELIRTLSSYKGEPQSLKLPSAPVQPIIVRTENNRPQPALDSMAGSPERARGMSVVAGRIRKSDEYYKLFVLSHNTMRGGAGGSLLNAELAKAKKLL
ncbi:MAG: aspartate-semialdehyde dehydrogenase [Methanomassiliicoccaceae archaeon]|jgi:aspartate-semialdehyde dehydrogenase|nr:aspartate-semialdehyde dehydrogenase [Methanomassiliicoccaceae archaeon]